MALQTYREPSGLHASCLGRLIYSSLPRIQTLGQGTPSLSCPASMLNQEKQPSGTGEWCLQDQASPVALETSPTSREKGANAKKAESAPPCLSTGAIPGTSVVLPLSPPIHLPGKQRPCYYLWLLHLTSGFPSS